MGIEPKATKLRSSLVRLGLPYKLANASSKLVTGYDKIRSSIALIVAAAQYACKSKHLNPIIKSSISNYGGALGFIKHLRQKKLKQNTNKL